jgi:hypothetical protein
LGEARPVPLPATDEPLRRQCAYFLDCVRHGTRPAPDGRLGLTVVRVLEQAMQSLHHHGRRERVQGELAGSEPHGRRDAAGHAEPELAREAAG